MRLFTIGSTRKTAEEFFETLKRSGTKRLVDVRLNNVSQLAGFAKKKDLIYFLERICGIEYVHEPLLAPEQQMLDAYKKGKGTWPAYERKFLQLMEQRHIEDRVQPEVLEESCLLCSEDKPHHCHRRLLAEYLNRHWGGVDVKHL